MAFRSVRSRVSLGLLLTIASIVHLSGCNKTETAADKPDPAVSASVAAFGEAPTDDECRQFVKEFGEVVSRGDAIAVNALIDYDAILQRATAGINIPARHREQFSAGVKSKILGSEGFAGQVVTQVKNGASYKLLRVHAVGEQKRALFRLLMEDKGLNYHDFVLVRQADGKVRAADVYIFLSAEMISQTLRRAYIPLAAQASQSILAKLTGSESDFAKHIDKMQRMAEDSRAGRHRQVLDAYERLPESLKREKTVLLFRVMAASSLSEEEYDQAVQAFRSACPDDPCIDLIALDSYYNHKNYTQARAAIDRLDKSLGGDPYLELFRANLYVEEKEYGKAMEHARKATDADKDLLPAYWAQVAIALEQKDFAEVSRLLTVLEEGRGVELDDLTTIPEYAEYVKSPQYQEWMKRKE